MKANWQRTLRSRLRTLLWSWRWTMLFSSRWRLSYGLDCQLKSPSRMLSSLALRRVALVRTDVSEESIVFLIRVTRIGELGDDTFLLNVRSYKSHAPSHSRRRHSSESQPWKPQILHSINRLGSVVETYCVPCEVRTGFLYPRRRNSS
jgi:hypothetical protein